MRIPVDSYRLPNGLLVSLSEDHSAPVVAVNLWYHVGSANERPGRTGFAHLFEHMLFQGSAQVGANEHFELIQRAGGTLNGSTWLERTNYFETVPSHHLALALWLEAERMGALLPAMTQEKLDTQRDVVKNERRWSVDNQPYGTWWERLPGLCYPPEHPFHHSLIGSMDDLSAASLEDVTEFFQAYYTPDNAVLTIAGDFDATTARAMVETYFGPIPRGTSQPPRPAMELPRTIGAWKRQIVEDDVNVPRLFLAFRAPPFGAADYYAGSICAAVLGQRRSSRLYQALVRNQEVASDVSAFTWDLAKGADLLVADVTARPGIDVAVLEAAVVAEIDLLRREGIRPDEVGRALALIETDYVSSMQAAGDRADAISKFATLLGDATLVNEQLDRYRDVTEADVNAFAHDVLGEDNRASLIFVRRAAPEGN
jgi:zinc protease